MTRLNNFTKNENIKLLQTLRDEVELSGAQLARCLNTSPQNLWDIITGQKELSALELVSLSTSLNFSLDALSEGKVDLNIIKNQFHGCGSKVSKKYQIGAFSKKSTISNLVIYVENNFGTPIANGLKLFFQINDSIFQSSEVDRVNYLFFEDAIKFLKSRGMSSSHVRAIGNHMVPFTLGSAFSEKMSSFFSLSELYEVYLSDLLNEVEQNNSYNLVYHNAFKSVLRSSERESALETFKIKNLGNKDRCEFRAGILETAPYYIGHSKANVTHSKCVHDGEDFCEFIIDYTYSAPINKQVIH